MLLKDVDIYALLPETYQNIYTQCISYALNKAIRLLVDYSDRVGVINNIDNLPESVLDHLAIEYDIKVYKQDRDIQYKRKLIKNALVSYLTAGTAHSMENTIANIYASSKVSEWYEYGGEPYHFKITATGVDTKDENSINEFLDVIESTKNVRSILDDVQVHYSLNAGLVHHSSNIKNSIKVNVNSYDNLIIIGSGDSENILTGGTITEPSGNLIYCS